MDKTSSDFELIMYKLSKGNMGATGVIYKMTGNEDQAISDDNFEMILALHTKGIDGAALYLIHNDGCNGSSAKCRLAFKAILDGTVNMTNLQIAILKEDRELFQDLFKEIKA